jgi:hypothetical protein
MSLVGSSSQVLLFCFFVFSFGLLPTLLTFLRSNFVYSGTEAPRMDAPSLSSVVPWCGDWTPFGNLGNESYDARMKEPLSQVIQSCRDTEVGLDYKPPPKQLYCNPPLTAHHRLPAILALDLQRQPKVQPEYTLVSPSHSVASVLNMTAPLIC